MYFHAARYFKIFASLQRRKNAHGNQLQNAATKNTGSGQKLLTVIQTRRFAVGTERFEAYSFSTGFRSRKAGITENLFKSLIRPQKCGCHVLARRLAVGTERFELSTLSGYASETYAYASSATCP